LLGISNSQPGQAWLDGFEFRGRITCSDSKFVAKGRYGMLLLLLLVLLVLAIGGGIVISKFLFLLLIVAIAVFVVSRVGRGSTF
jgi:hypothetical protein